MTYDGFMTEMKDVIRLLTIYYAITILIACLLKVYWLPK
jgi:hypothetical protein